MDRILLLEDYEGSRILLELALRNAFGAVPIDSAVSLAEAFELLERSTFDLAILDLNLPDGCGIDLLRKIKTAQPDTYCVIATVADDDESLFESLKAGAQGYLLKSDTPLELATNLEGMLTGHPPLSPQMATRVINYFNSLGRSGDSIASHLTEREKEVLELIVQGASRKAIARELGITVNTANDHVKSIYRKLKVSSRVEATRMALEQGLSH